MKEPISSTIQASTTVRRRRYIVRARRSSMLTTSNLGGKVRGRPSDYGPSPVGGTPELARYCRLAMAYQSLYRKYRPQRFAEVVGQHHVTTAIRNAVRDE